MKLLTRSQVLRRLRAHAARHGDLSAKWLQDNKPEIYTSVLAHFESLATARDAAGVSKRSRSPLWSQERVLAELRRLQRQGRIRITTTGLARAGYLGLVGAIYKTIGSMPRARRLARIPELGSRSSETTERWDEDRVISEIRDRHRQQLSLASSKVPSKLREAANTHCGNWRAAIEMAGFDYKQTRLHREAWTRDEVLTQLRRAARMRTSGAGRGHTLTSLIGPVRKVITAMFGSVSNALVAAGFDPAVVMQRVPRRRRSARAILDELRALVRACPTIRSGELARTTVGREARRRFESLRAVTERLAIPGWPLARPTTLPSADDVLRLLRERHQRGDWMSLDRTVLEESRLARAGRDSATSWDSSRPDRPRGRR
jgi:hypothetical protein